MTNDSQIVIILEKELKDQVKDVRAKLKNLIEKNENPQHVDEFNYEKGKLNGTIDTLNGVIIRTQQLGSQLAARDDKARRDNNT